MHFFRRDPWAAVAAGALVSIMILAGAPLAAIRAGGASIRAEAPAAPIRAGAPASVPRAQPRLAAGSPKPDWRGADLGNSGAEAVNGPAVTATQVFNVNPGQGGGVIQGIELDGASNVLFTKNDGFVYSYTPAGTQNWVVNTGSSFGSDVNGAASNPVASADGNVYVATDQGNLLRINAATGASTQFVNYGAPVQQTLKVDDATNNVFFGGQDHFINSYSKAGANVYSTAATGSTQDGTLTPSCSGAVSGGNTALFYGEGALDSSDNFYVGDLETKSTGPRACSITLLGTLYKMSATGSIVAKAPLAGPEVGAVVLAPNAAVAGGSELVVATKQGFVEAFDTALNRLWATRVANASVNASPAVDVARNRVYAADNASALHALNLTTGAIDTTFNSFAATGAMTGTANLTGGTNSSPIVDAGGNVYAVDSTGTLFKFSPSGATVYSFNTGIGTGFFSPAIATDGTIYVGGNVGQASGFNAATGSTATAGTGTSTPAAGTSTPTAGTGTSSATAAATGASTATAGTSTSTATAGTSTSTAMGTPATATNTPLGGATATRTPLGGATATNTVIGGATATNTPTNTPTPTPTNTPTSTPTNTPTSTPTSTSTSTPATGTPATGTPTVSPGLAPFWSKARSDLHNDGNANLKLDLSQPPGILFTTQISPGAGQGAITGLFAAPAIGPSPDGDATSYRIYQIDNSGQLNAVRPDGSIAWTSSAVLGSYQSAASTTPGGSAGSPPFAAYRPGSPAIAADGTIYAVSEANYPNGDSGIWRFDPRTGTSTQFFARGNYLGGSPAIGPDGTVYAGDVQGNVYAINKDGSQRYAYAVTAGGDCPAGTSPLIQSAPALDKQGNLYVGYGCAGATFPAAAFYFAGGVLALSPTGSEIWHYNPTAGTGRQAFYNPEVVNPVVLSPDEKTVYAEGYRGTAQTLPGAHAPVSLPTFYALNASDGTRKWGFVATSTASGSFGYGSPSLASIALSPDGSLTYILVDGNATESVPDLYVLHASDGSIAATASYPNSIQGRKSPAVDANGNVLVALDNGDVLAYGPGLGAPLFDYPESTVGGSYLEGPVLGPDGAIFLTDNLGNLHALKQGLILPPSPTPTFTPGPTNTNTPPPTFTSVPPVPTDVPLCPGVPTSTNTATPVATATSTNTATPAAYTPTSTSTGTPLPTATACPSVTVGTRTPGGGTPGAGTPTPGVGTPGHGGTPTPGRGTLTPTATATPVKTPAPVSITVPGLKVLRVFAGYLTVGNLVRVHAETTPTARITYTFRVSYDYPPAKGQHAAKGRRTIAIRPILHRSSGPRLGVIQPAVALLPNGAAVAAKATLTPTPRPAGKGKPTPTPRPSGKGKPAGRPTGKPATTCSIVATILDRGTLHFTRTADRHGVDDYCLRIGAVPSRAIDLRIVITAQVRSGSKTFPSSSPTTVLVKRPPAKPPTVKVRLILPSKIDASVRHNVLYTDQTQTVSSFTASYTHVTYRVAYPGGLTRAINVVADHNGNNTTSFRVSYLPPPSVRARATISVLTTQRIGRTTRHAQTSVLTFFVRRAPAIVRSRATLPNTIDASLLYHVLYTDQTETVSSFTARHARVTYRIAYPNGVSRTITVAADRDGNNTTRFRVSYLPAPLVRAHATITVLATQQVGRTTRRARPYVLTFYVRRAPAIVRSRTILPSTIDASLLYHVLYTDQTETVSSFTARHARVTYRIAYPNGVSRTINVVADRNGNNTTRFRVSYLPAPLVRARATITVLATQQVGRTTRRARPYVLTLFVRRAPEFVRSRATLPGSIDALVRHHVLYTGQIETVSSFTARHARVTYSIRYPNGLTRTITVEADHNGNNTTSFRVTYLPGPSVRARATITVVATQQAGRTTRRARPYALTFYVRRDPHRR